jgi:hypothetical protein
LDEDCFWYASDSLNEKVRQRQDAGAVSRRWATEIAIILRFDLLFQSLRDYFGDVGEFHILYRIVALSEIVDPSKGKITRR